MGLAQYQILPQGDEWGVLHDGDVRNRYATKEAAFEAAVAAASLAIREGHEVHINVPDRTRRLLAQVTRYGNDVLLFGAVGENFERVFGRADVAMPSLRPRGRI